MDKLIQMMLTAFANNFTFYLKAHNFHWVVSGETFKQDHEFLGEIYEDAQGAIDDYAEQMRRIGAFPQGDIKEIIANSAVIDPPLNEMMESEEMFMALATDLVMIVSTLQDTYDQAGIAREYGLQNFLADRIDAHRKQQWMITATLTEEPTVEGQIIAPTQVVNPTTGDTGYVIDSTSMEEAMAQGYKAK